MDLIMFTIIVGVSFIVGYLAGYKRGRQIKYDRYSSWEYSDGDYL